MQCSTCHNHVPDHAIYCGKCGSKIEKPGDHSDYLKRIKKIAVFFFVLLGYIAVLSFTSFGSHYTETLILDLLFAAIILVFYLFNRKETNRLLRFDNPRWHVVLMIVLLAPMLALLVSFIADFLNESIFDTSQNAYYQHFLSSPAPLTLSIISIGLFPAIFEEIAFRGIIFNDLLKLTRLKSVIVISAILFTILHLSLISILWIFPMGLAFGYFRAKYRTMWYGIIGHFVYNSSIVLIEYLTLQFF